MPDTLTDIDAAQREAETASKRLAEVERAALENPPGKRPSAADVAEQRHLAEFASRRVQVTRDRAEQERAKQRLTGLEALGEEIDKLAVTARQPSSAMATAAQQIAAGAAAFTAACREHDERVRDLHQRAEDYGSEQPTPTGPRASSAYVARSGGGSVTHHLRQVSPIGERVGGALQLALSGDADGALAALSCVTDHAEHRRAEQYFVASGGMVLTCGAVVPPHIKHGLASGTVRPMTGEQIAAYLEGGEI